MAPVMPGAMLVSVGPVAGALTFGERCRHHEHGGRRRGDDEPAHRVDPPGGGPAADQRGQQQDEDHAQHLRRHPPGEYPRPLVIIVGEGRAPAELRDGGQRVAQIEDHQEGEGRERGESGLGHEDEPYAGGEGEAAGEQPGAIAAESAARSVHPVAEQGIERQVDRPDEEEDEADGGEVEAERPGVIRRQIDDHRQPDGADRKARPGEGRKSRTLQHRRLPPCPSPAEVDCRQDYGVGARDAIELALAPVLAPKARVGVRPETWEGVTPSVAG
jgi:hypothetical protein